MKKYHIEGNIGGLQLDEFTTKHILQNKLWQILRTTLKNFSLYNVLTTIDFSFCKLFLRGQHFIVTVSVLSVYLFFDWIYGSRVSHIQNVWNGPSDNEELECKCEPGNSSDPYAVAVMKEITGDIHSTGSCWTCSQTNIFNKLYIRI